MPTYEYRCQNGHEFEVFQSIKDTPLDQCPECQATAKRLISAGGGLVFKGSGFYITDYKKNGNGGNGNGKKDKTGNPDAPSTVKTTNAVND